MIGILVGVKSEMKMPSRTSRIGEGGPAQASKSKSICTPMLELITTCERIDQATDWQIHKDCHTVIVHVGGRMSELETEIDGVGGSIGPANPGEVWSVPAGRRYASHARGQMIRYAVYSFDTTSFGLLDADDCRPFDISAVAGQRDDELFALTCQLLRALEESHDHAELNAETLMNDAFWLINQHYRSNEVPGRFKREQDRLPALSDKTARALREFVFDNLGERISLELLAQIAELTVHHLLLAFRKSFGTTPAQYLILQRLRRAMWLLTQTNTHITEIALATGFSSHSHFTTAFTQKFGFPPSAFRERHSQ